MQLVSISLKNATSNEIEAKIRLENIFKKYDVSPYIFTNKVIIENHAIPHSHPVLTLNSFPYTDDNIVLDAFIHEQLHWFFEKHYNKVNKAVNELKQKYPKAPWGAPLGCKDQTSTYEHLLLCWLSNQIMTRLTGDDAAAKVLYFLQNHHYIWVFQEVEKSSMYLSSLIDKHELSVKS